MATGARRPSLARIGAGPEPIKALLVGEEESNPVSSYGVRFLAEQPNPQNPVTDSVESCLLQGLRYYEFRRAVIIRSICRPKFVCVPTAPAQLRGVRFS